jgi:hypothetical protein
MLAMLERTRLLIIDLCGVASYVEFAVDVGSR